MTPVERAIITPELLQGLLKARARFAGGVTSESEATMEVMEALRDLSPEPWLQDMIRRTLRAVAADPSILEEGMRQAKACEHDPG